MTDEIFCLVSRQGQQQDKDLEARSFVAYLLIPLALAVWLCFCLIAAALMVLLIGLAINGAMFAGGEIAVGLFGCSL